MPRSPPRTWALLAAFVLFLASGAVAEEEPAPSAVQVMVRGRTKLVEALQAALGPAPTDGSIDVLIILDVTPYTAAQGLEIGTAVAALRRLYPEGHWRFARLGEKPSKAFAHAGFLDPIVRASLATDTAVPATLPALAATLKSGAARGARVVYLADWRFEDDVGLEKLVRALRRDRSTFSVVGGEAGFGRAWTDGFYPPNRGQYDAKGRSILYAEGIGRSPFGPEDPQVPWHGGDTAWPHLPYHVGGTTWSTKFPVELAPPPRRSRAGERDRYGQEKEKETDPERSKREDGTPEDLQDRLSEEHTEGTLERFWFPLPSGFGSYPLMRLAGATGGKYVLWSWNASGRSEVSYDYGRCGAFAPDLRPRKEIHEDIRARPLARALLTAWHAITQPKTTIASVTPPVGFDAHTALEMQETRGSSLPFSWGTKGEYLQFMAYAPVHRAALERGIAALRSGLREPRRDAVDARYEADALLMLHMLEVKHFQLGEAVAAAGTLDVKTAWDRLPLHPNLVPTWHVPPSQELDVPTGIRLHDEAAGAEIVEKRRAFRERFAGTPFGELVRRNGVTTYELLWLGYAEGRPAKESPAESGTQRPHTPPPSGGAGPVTGR